MALMALKRVLVWHKQSRNGGSGARMFGGAGLIWRIAIEITRWLRWRSSKRAAWQ